MSRGPAARQREAPARMARVSCLRAMAPAPEPSPVTVELTCTRAVCHVVYVVSVDLLPLLLGGTCPKCGKGVLELREHAVMTLR